MHSTRVSLLVRAPRAAVWRALVDPDAIARWRVPDGMTGHVHEFDAREGGQVRVSLTYDAPGAVGKSDARTDTYRGVITAFEPGERIVEAIEFESDDPAVAGTMTQTTTLADVDGGTEVTVAHEGIPDAVSPTDNEVGTRMALANLAILVESANPA